MFGVQFILHGFLVGRREFFQVLFHHGLAVVHLLAHQLADLLALFTAQVQLASPTAHREAETAKAHRG